MSVCRYLLLFSTLYSLALTKGFQTQTRLPTQTLFDQNPLLYTAILQANQSLRNLNKNTTSSSTPAASDFCIPDLSNLNSTIFEYLNFSGKSPNDYGFYSQCQNLTTHADIMAISPPNYMRVNYKAQGQLDIFWGICFPQKCLQQVKFIVSAIAPLVYSQPPEFQKKFIDKFEPVTESHPLSILMISIACFFVLLGIIGMIIQYSSIGDFKFWNQDDEVQSKNLIIDDQNMSSEIKPSRLDISLKAKDSTILESDQDTISFQFQGKKSPRQDRLAPTIDNIDILDRKQRWAQFLMSFSLTYNLNKLVTRQRPRTTLDVLDGVRVLSIFWVILGHSYVFIASAGARNLVEITSRFPKQFLYTLVLQGNLAVDTFFFLSAFLGAYIFLKKYPTNKRCINPLQVLIAYFHRYYRLTPLLAFIMYFCAFVVYPLASGPARMSLYNVDIQNCKKYGWKQIVYVMNLVGNSKQQCFAWAWYLSNDMQMFLILPWIIILYKFLPLLGTVVLGVLFLGNFIATGIISYNNDFGVTQFSHDSHFMQTYYVKPWIRVLPYLIGIGFAMMYQNYKSVDDYQKKVAKWRKQHGSHSPIQQIDDLKNKRPVRKGFGYYIFNSARKSTLMTWIYFLLGFAITFIMVFILYQPYKDLGDAWTRTGKTFYNIFGRGVFIVGLAMVLIPLFVGRLTMLADFLSCEMFSVMAKITYSVYLLHEALITIFNYSYQVESYITHLEAVMTFFTFTVLSYLIGAFVSLLIDFPLGNIDKVFIFPDKKKQKENYQRLKAYLRQKRVID